MPLRFFLIGLIVLLTSLSDTSESSEKQTRPPNFIVILMDDMGWRDVGFMGNSFVETPQIDMLAKSGLVFTQAYASAPNCAPTRACLMSGQYTPRHGIYTVVDPRQPPGSPWHKLTAAESKSELDTNVVTIAEALSSSNSRHGQTSEAHASRYATAFFGMWNLGRGRTGPVTPGGQGFQKVVFPENLGFGKDEYFDDNQNYLSDRLTDEVIQFVEDHRDEPFFVYLPDHAVHAPFNPKPDLLKKYQKKAEQLANPKAASNNPPRGKNARNSDGNVDFDPAYAATIEAVDQNVGRLVKTLDRLKLTENTVIIFTSDNGGTQQFTAPLNGSKGQLYEGGIRVPLVVSWSGLKKPGTTTDIPVTSVDLYPTLLDLAGVNPPSNQLLDGLSLVPILQGSNSLERNRLFWHFPCYVGKSTPASALREGNFKLIEFFEEGGHLELYDLKSDPYEKRNLADSMPEKAKAMYRVLQNWQKETDALLPAGPNPNYDARAERPRGGQPGGNEAGKPGRNKGKNKNAPK